MKKILVISLLLLITACANKQSMLFDYGTAGSEAFRETDPAISYLALEKAPLCCNSLSELNYQQITESGKVELNITDKNQAFNFSTGKSFVKGFALPKVNGDIKITVSAPVIDSVFVPTLLVLDEYYEPIQVYGQDTFIYDQASVLHVSRYFGQIELSVVQTDNRHARYILILTTEKAMQETTLLPEPDSSAIELGRADTVYQMHTNKPLPHTAIGAIKISFNYKGSSIDSAQAMVTNYGAVPKPTGATIQPETESMYITLIEQAVSNGELDKAQRFVEEAERAGSNKARDALLDAQQKYAR